MARNMNRETLEQKIAKTEKAISRNGKSRGQNRRCMMHTWKASVYWMKSLT